MKPVTISKANSAQKDQNFPISHPAKPPSKLSPASPPPQTLTGIQSLHDLYNNEYNQLLTAYQGRERARLQQEAELKANPPKPKDLVINYWRIEAPTPQKGGAK